MRKSIIFKDKVGDMTSILLNTALHYLSDFVGIIIVYLETPISSLIVRGMDPTLRVIQPVSVFNIFTFTC